MAIREVLKWFSTIIMLIGVAWISFGLPYWEWHFVLLATGHAILVEYFWITKDKPLITLNGVFFLIDCAGIYTWLL